MGLRTRFAALGDAYRGFADRQLKPLLRGMDAERASGEEIRGLAWDSSNLRGGNVRRADPDARLSNDAFLRAQQELREGTVPAGGWREQAPVSNEEPNILGRLLVSDLDDEVANRLLNDTEFTAALGTTPAQLQAARLRIKDAVDMGSAIQSRNLDELAQQGFSTPGGGPSLLTLRDQVRANPNNVNVSRLLDEVRDPRIAQLKSADVFDEVDPAGAPSQLRSQLAEPQQPKTFKEYKQLKQQQEKNLRRALQRDGKTAAESDAFIKNNPSPNLPELTEQQFNEIVSTLDDPFLLGVEVQKGVPRNLPTRPDSDRIQEEFLSDFLTRKLGVSPDTIDLADASGNPEVKRKALLAQATKQLSDELNFAGGYTDPLKVDVWEDDGRALGQMRDAVIGAENIGNRATDLLQADELARQRTALERMRGGEKVRIRDPWTGQLDSGLMDPDVRKFVAELEDIQEQARTPEEVRGLIDLKVAELNASRPDVVEAGLRYLDSKQLNSKPTGGGRKTAAKVLAKADRAGMDVPLLSKEAQETYRAFVNPNNPMNIGTPVLAMSSGGLAIAGALLVDAMKEEELDEYASSMAKQQSIDTLRKADPTVLAAAIENAGWY